MNTMQADYKAALERFRADTTSVIAELKQTIKDSEAKAAKSVVAWILS